MLKLADLVDQHRETLATIETWDNGTSSHFTSFIFQRFLNVYSFV